MQMMRGCENCYNEECSGNQWKTYRIKLSFINWLYEFTFTGISVKPFHFMQNDPRIVSKQITTKNDYYYKNLE